jgi:hypothetical protein
MTNFFHCVSIEKLSFIVGFLSFAGKQIAKVNFLENFASKQESNFNAKQFSWEYIEMTRKRHLLGHYFL